MRIDGEWFVGDDGLARPVIRGEALSAGGLWIGTPFLMDTGADRTVLTAAALELLGLSGEASPDRIGGLGGVVRSVSVQTKIRLTRESGAKVHFRGEFTAVTELQALDMCILGRDITGLFAVIVDLPNDVVCLVRERHRYVMEET
jgi:hypothetical protein